MEEVSIRLTAFPKLQTGQNISLDVRGTYKTWEIREIVRVDFEGKWVTIRVV